MSATQEHIDLDARSAPAQRGTSGSASAPGSTAPAADASLGELLGRLGTDLADLVRKEVELAKVEVKESAARAGQAAGLLSAGGAAALIATLLLAFSLAWTLAAMMPAGLAFFIVGVVFVAAAAACVVIGRKKLQAVSPVPQQTVETLKEDVQWAKTQLR